MRLNERAAERVADPVLPLEELRAALGLALALVHVGRDGRDELERLEDDGARLELRLVDRVVARGAREERLEEHPVPRHSLDGQQQVRLERDLRVARVRSAALWAARASQ